MKVCTCATDFADLVFCTGEVCPPTGRRYFGIEKFGHVAEISQACLNDPVSRIPIIVNADPDMEHAVEYDFPYWSE